LFHSICHYKLKLKSDSVNHRVIYQSSKVYKIVKSKIWNREIIIGARD
jgi:hypothetical protein